MCINDGMGNRMEVDNAHLTGPTWEGGSLGRDPQFWILMGISFRFKVQTPCKWIQVWDFLILLMLGLCLMISFKNFIFVELGFLATI
jgi:hypothetical protein